MKALTPLFIVLVSVVSVGGCEKKNVVSSSMSPTIKQGETVTVDYSAYMVGQPERWDVVVFQPPMFTNQLWAMRVVALPGETVSVSNGITIDGRAMSLPAHLTNVSYLLAGSSARSYVVPAGSFFVLGDNSQNANDSRFWGGLPATNIVGKVKRK
jgi:signal peptidase I